ncbi:MbtH family protein [Pleionea sediminis]|uniref:MbtH family protein n=1 Tax=Pleionea sediminis TaxID=2569479 RepID=UPI00118681BD|nr:MbtH family NRPS accessory protein [Pleionea sediminis]
MFDNMPDLEFKVVYNGEEQYSIWPAFRDIPPGWIEEGFVGKKEDCLNHIEKVWVDMRPKSLRDALEQTH